MKPWTIRSKFSETVNLTFTPFFERVAKTDAKLISSEVHQMIGYYNGIVKLENCSLRISQMIGCTEEHIAKW